MHTAYTPLQEVLIKLALVPTMQLKQLPTESEMVLLKRELNHLLWTNDSPPLPEGIPILAASGATSEAMLPNIQCTSHAAIVSALMMRRGFSVTTRGGKAFVLDPSPDQNPADDWLNEIAKHWWLTVDGLGLVDLSLFAESEHPLVYGNRSPGDRWQIHFSDSFDKLRAFLSARKRGCLYVTVSKKRATKADFEQCLTQSVPPAKVAGIPLNYAHLVEHCEHLIAGSKESLTRLPQKEAWQGLLN